MEALAAVEAFFRDRPYGIAAAYVFGSVGRGESRPGSDLDVAVLLSEEPPATLDGMRGDLAEGLERVVGCDVDLLVLNRAPADLVHRVLQDGRLVLETDRGARVAFEVRRRREYFDLLPILEEYRRPAKGGRRVTDPALVGKKLATIETALAELRTLAVHERLGVEIKERRFVEHTLQLAIQAALDVASHIVSDQRLGEPRTSRELFDLLERAVWVPPDLASSLRGMTGFRNVLVHGYDEVDLAIVRDVLEHRLTDLDRFVALVRERLDEWLAPGPGGPLRSAGDDDVGCVTAAPGRSGAAVHAGPVRRAVPGPSEPS